ncbi:hypothetical protein NDU88_001511 [Pleurodeles waltl]|uniref:Uncharacterized protein n=1 Tax=Pleurodeles waltl TaxID=8319 RepID=A0AAV7SCY0_PLEWA|nr:hypothetical protein NDU88_001511 [Pleurodeles waltl]
MFYTPILSGRRCLPLVITAEASMCKVLQGSVRALSGIYMTIVRTVLIIMGKPNDNAAKGLYVPPKAYLDHVMMTKHEKGHRLEQPSSSKPAGGDATLEEDVPYLKA